MIQRMEYMNKLIKWRDHKVIKVVTGVRRCGKSTLLQLFREYLYGHGVDEDACISINFENIAFENLKEYHKMYDYILEHLQENKMNYIFLDEVQLVPEFEKAVNSLLLKDNVDIYMTGSNAYMLSSELATLLSGRYVEIKMLPFSFKEYYELVGGEARKTFHEFLRRGGFPYLALIEDDDARHDYVEGIYSTVLLKDIVGRKRVSDVELLEAVIKFLFDNVGNIVSTKKIADTLTSMGRKTTAVTVDGYVRALKDAFILYEVGRYDVKGKQYLQSLEKYYIVDTSLRSFLLGERTMDLGHILENIVYLELQRRGYKVSIGKLGTLEVDFVAQRGDEKIYYQVAASVLDPATYEREFAPLKKIRDSYPKVVFTLDDYPMGEEGINQQNVIEWLLN